MPESLRSILTVEEANVVTLFRRERGSSRAPYVVGRALGMSEARVDELLKSAAAKIKRHEEAKVAGLTVVQCACGISFEPRRKGEDKCPACRLLGDDPPMNGSAHEPAEEPAHEPAQMGGALDNGNGHVTPPSRRFGRSPLTVAEIEARRDRIVAAVEAAGRLDRAGIAAATGLDIATVGNDLTRLVPWRLRKVPTSGRSYDLVPADAVQEPEPDPAAAAREALVQEAEDAARARGHEAPAEPPIPAAPDPEPDVPEGLPPPQSETPPSASVLADAARRAGRPDLATRVEQMLGIEPESAEAWRDRYMDALLARIRAGHECPEHVYARFEGMLGLAFVPADPVDDD